MSRRPEYPSMADKAFGPPKTDKIEQAEYVFGDVPDSEVKTALFYELLRESSEVRASAGSLRESWKAVGYLPDLTGEIWFSPIGIRHAYHIFFAHVVGFPDRPWLELNNEARSVISQRFCRWEREHLNHDHYRITPPGPGPHDNLPAFEGMTFDMNPPGWKFKMWKQLIPHESAFLVGAFVIDLSRSKEEIISDAKAYLRTLPLKGEPLGRPRWRDTLNGLGAMRLKYHSSSQQKAKDKLKESYKDIPSDKVNFFALSDNSAWRTSIRNAARFYDSLGLSEPPLRWPGWSYDFKKLISASGK